jgi:hypothetical protein
MKISKLSKEGMQIAGTESWGEVWEVYDGDGVDEVFIGFFVSEQAANDYVTMAADAARYRKFATLPDQHWVTFNFPSTPGFGPVLPVNRKGWVDEELDALT